MPATSRTARFGVLILTCLAVAFSTLLLSPAPAANAAASHRTARVFHALSVARHQIGDPYRYGADGPGSFDCSGLTYYAMHKRSGFRNFPRTAAEQARFTHHIRRGQMRRGDLMFFFNGGGVYHVGIFDGWRHGHRLVLHAPYPGARVRVEPVWTNAWFPGTTR